MRIWLTGEQKPNILIYCIGINVNNNVQLHSEAPKITPDSNDVHLGLKSAV